MPNTSAGHKPSSLDIWLSRGSNIAQVGLFALTLAALYYTVIPLYKTAALEEQIAQREAQLKTVENRLAATESAVTEAKESLYREKRGEALRRFILTVGPKCSGLFSSL